MIADKNNRSKINRSPMDAVILQAIKEKENFMPTENNTKKQYESGHPKTLESWDKLIAQSEMLDQSRLNPPDDLKLQTMKDVRTETTGLQTTVGNSRADWRTIALDRATDIDRFDSLAAQAIAAFEARSASPEKAKDARGYVKKLTGKRAAVKKKVILDENGNPVLDLTDKGISAAQTSSAAKISTMYELVDYLEAQPEYAAVTKAGLTAADMRSFTDATQTKHTSSIASVAKLSTDRANRNKRFYLDTDSICERARRFKQLVGSEYGFNSPEYKAVKAIPFHKPKL